MDNFRETKMTKRGKLSGAENFFEFHNEKPEGLK